MEFLFVCSFFLVVVVIDMFGFCFKKKAKDMFSKIGKCKNSLGWFFLFFFSFEKFNYKRKIRWFICKKSCHENSQQLTILMFCFLKKNESQMNLLDDEKTI